MHETAFYYAGKFFETYVKDSADLNIVEIGSQVVGSQQSLRMLKPPLSNYAGYDFVEGEGVDFVLNHPFKLPIEDASVDVIVTSSCYEHSSFFWMNFLEAMRVLKPKGLLYVNAPSNGVFHRYPVDSWRFYPDAGNSLVQWGRYNSYECELLESFIGATNKNGYPWNDFVAVFLKDKKYIESYKKRIIDDAKGFTNGVVDGKEGFYNYDEMRGR